VKKDRGIPPVEKWTEDELEEEEIYRARPQWFKFFYGAWYASTASMDDDQKGWYITLLTWAAAEGDPPGYLPEDEEELKEIAGFRPLNPAVTEILRNGIDISEEVLTKLREARERKWQKVRKKFTPDRNHPGYLRNRRLMVALDEAYRKIRLQKERAEFFLKKKPRKSKRIRGLIKTPIGAPIEKFGNRENPDQKSGEIGEFSAPDNVLQNKGIPETPEGAPLGDLFYDLSLNSEDRSTQEEMIPSLPLFGEEKRDQDSRDQSSPEEMIVLEVQDISLVRETKKSRKKIPETLFDEDKFHITPHMKEHLLSKYPEFVQGDLDWMEYKFKLRFHGLRYSSWSRTFYNFVENQLVKYNYKPGSFDWRRQAEGLTNESGRPKQRPWESAAARNSRLEQEEVERTSELRARSQRGDQENPQGLPLTPDNDS
jgi:hypothetical protein